MIADAITGRSIAVLACATVVALAAIVLVAARGTGSRTSGSPGPTPERAEALTTARTPSDSTLGRTWIEMRNVDLHVSTSGILHVHRLHGEVIPATPGTPAVLDDPKSFSIRITAATVGLDGAGLTALMNDVVFAYPGAPLKKMSVRVEGDHIVQKGVMHKGVDIPFTITASLDLASDGRIRIHPTDTRIFGVDGAKLLHALGLRLDKLLDLSGSRGAEVKGDDIYLDAAKALPPPAISGRIARVRVANGEVLQEFTRIADDSLFGSYVRPDTAVPNFVYFRGGSLRFGKLLMSDTDLQILDGDERNPLDLYLQQYAKQLVAGISRTLQNQGLQVVMPDFASLAAGAKQGNLRFPEATP